MSTGERMEKIATNQTMILIARFLGMITPALIAYVFFALQGDVKAIGVQMWNLERTMIEVRKDIAQLQKDSDKNERLVDQIERRIQYLERGKP